MVAWWHEQRLIYGNKLNELVEFDMMINKNQWIKFRLILGGKSLNNCKVYGKVKIETSN